ncbi:MAG: hypothetical protein U5N85_08625 [Arcicella sp.]|nr:hypothetical protein [Arcicella sp.]
MKNLSIIFSLALLIFISSCKKDESTTPSKPKKDILVSKTWLLADVTALGSVVAFNKDVKPTSNNLIDLSKVRLAFKTDGTMTGIDNNGKAIAGGKWTLSTDETKLNISNTGIIGVDGEQTVIQIIETNLDIKGKVIFQGTLVDATIKAIPE